MLCVHITGECCCTGSEHFTVITVTLYIIDNKIYVYKPLAYCCGKYGELLVMPAILTDTIW